MVFDRALAQELRAHLEQQKAAMVDFLISLVRAESPSLQPETQPVVLRLLAHPLEEIGYQSQHHPGKRSGGHLVVFPVGHNHRQPRQILLGHSDTVWPLGTLATMPIQVTEERVTGPGVYDMKGGLTQMVFALRALHALALTPPVTPLVFVNSDEEIGSRDSAPQIMRLAKVADRVLVLEPALGPLGKLKTGRKGVGHFTLEVTGRPAHAGLEPEKGASAILELSYQIQQLFALNDPAKGVTVNVGLVEGGQRANVVAPTSKAVVDVRVPTEEDGRRMEAEILNLKPVTPGVRLNISGRFDRPPLEPTPRNRDLWELTRTIGRQLDLELAEGTAGGASDGNFTSQFAATLDGLGPVGDGAHARHEFIYLEKLVERTALLAGLLMAPPLARGA